MAKKNEPKPRTVEQTLIELFKVKNLISEMEAKKKEFQEELDQYCDQHIDDFVDGVLMLPGAQVNIVNNPPKLVATGSGKTLSVNARGELCELLDPEYVELKPNMTKIVSRVNGDKKLKQLLKSTGVEIAQDTRFQAKPV